MDFMTRNKVQELIDLPPRSKPNGNKWIFKIKRQVDGSINKFKVRLVAKGFIQIECINYKRLFSRDANSSIRLLLVLVAHLNLQLFQMDIKTVFLSGNLEEEIYIDQPIGFVSKGQEGKGCHLK